MRTLSALCLGLALAAASPAASRAAVPPPASRALKPCAGVAVDPPVQLALGKSQVVELPFPAARMIVGGRGSRAAVPAAAPASRPAAAAPAAATGVLPNASDGVADTEVALLSPTELFVLGERTGTMNVVLQSADGRCLVKDLVVTIDPSALQAKLRELLPGETGIQVRGADDALVLAGTVADSVHLEQALSVATSFGDGKKVVNLLRVTAPQQVMLEVKIAEVSKTLLDRFGLDFSRLVTNSAGLATSIISGLVGANGGTLGRFTGGGGLITGTAAGAVGSATNAATASVTTASHAGTLLGIDAQNKDGIIRILAEPNILAISGQSASFLSGGKIFIPVAQSRDGVAGSTITLEEKEFGVGLKFTPTVLADGRINLKLVSEVSELSQTGSPFTSINGVTAILPSMATRRVDTTVQLGDGQSFAVAGLIKHNTNEALKKIPGLGEVPVMGALFSSNEFQTDQTELMFVVTPRLVKPVMQRLPLPTDSLRVPDRNAAIFGGAGEAPAAAPVPNP